MAHYAFLNSANVVTEVIGGIDETELIEGLLPETWYGNFRGQVCKRTSYNTLGGINSKGGIPYRKNYAGIGYTYDAARDAFIGFQQYASWVFNEETCLWDTPVPRPATGRWQWNEATLSWIPMESG